MQFQNCEYYFLSQEMVTLIVGRRISASHIYISLVGDDGAVIDTRHRRLRSTLSLFFSKEQDLIIWKYFCFWTRMHFQVFPVMFCDWYFNLFLHKTVTLNDKLLISGSLESFRYSYFTPATSLCWSKDSDTFHIAVWTGLNRFDLLLQTLNRDSLMVDGVMCTVSETSQPKLTFMTRNFTTQI